MKTFLKALILILGISLLGGAVYLYFVSNFNVGVILQGGVSVPVILYGLFFNKIKKKGHVFICAIFLIPLAFSAALAIYGNNDNAEFDEDVAIVLGAGIRGEVVSANLAKRLDATVEYFGKNPDAMIIVCGGKGSYETIPEAEAMKRYLLEKGIPEDRIIMEDQSASTYENFLYANIILSDIFPDGFSSVLITNDFHVYRATKLAENVGISARHIGAKTEWYTIPANYLREMTAVIHTWINSPDSIKPGQYIPV